MLHVRLNDEAVEVEEPSTVLQLLECRRPPFARPASYARDAEGIRHRACPLVKVIELDGRVTPIALAAGRPLREGTEVRTRSPLLERTLADRLRRLRENGECEIIAQLQEFAAAEAESAGLVDLEKRSQWRFEPRLSAPSIFHDPNRCVRCRACVDTCNETQGVGALSYDENQGVLFDESKCTRCGQCIHSWSCLTSPSVRAAGSAFTVVPRASGR